MTDPTLPNWAEPFWDPLTARLWAHSASLAEGWALCGAALLAAVVTYAAVWVARTALDGAAAKRG